MFSCLYECHYLSISGGQAIFLNVTDSLCKSSCMLNVTDCQYLAVKLHVAGPAK